MIDLDKVSKLTGFVDKLIQLKGIEDTLDEEKMVENFLGRPADNKPFLKSIGLENL